MTNTSKVRVIRRRVVEATTGLSRSSIYARINPKSPGYDPTFPKSISLGGRAVGWIESEIETWLEEQISQSRPTGTKREG